jgi:pantoate--beta-alanine ligase
LSLCRKEGVDFVFLPDSRRMYPEGFGTFVNVERLSNVLCGKSRPGHFRGVATVVAKLFNIAQPDIAYFGQKDAQQAAVIRQMCRDLHMPLEIKVLPTVREKDGLALSSRNAYLNKEERKEALVLFKALKLAQLLINHGQRNAALIIRKMRHLITRVKSAKVDYIAIVDPDSLIALKKITGNYMIALAVHIGKTRLIDNIEVRKVN